MVIEVSKSVIDIHAQLGGVATSEFDRIDATQGLKIGVTRGTTRNVVQLKHGKADLLVATYFAFESHSSE